MKKLTAAIAALFAMAAVLVGLSSSAHAAASFTYYGPSEVTVIPGKMPLPQTYSHKAVSNQGKVYASAARSLTPAVCSASLSQVTFTALGTCTLEFDFPAVSYPGKGVLYPAFSGTVSIPVRAR